MKNINIKTGKHSRTIAAAFVLVLSVLLLAGGVKYPHERPSGTQAADPHRQLDNQADLVVRNAAIYTVDAARSWAQAFAVKDGRLVFVGGETEVDRWIGAATRVVDAGGRLILPGFHDTHIHLRLAAEQDYWCDTDYPATLEATSRALTRCVETSSARDWVVAVDANEAVFPPDGPPLGYLDTFEQERPMLVVPADYHSLYVNSTFMALVGIESAVSDPEGTQIVRDAEGRPTGTLRGAAAALAWNHVPQPTPDEWVEQLTEQFAKLAPNGIASVQELQWIDEWAAAVESSEQLVLRTRIAQGVTGYAAQGVSPSEGIGQVAERAGRFQTRRFTVGAIKIFTDGTLAAQTAALSEPYLESASPAWRGEAYFTQDDLNAWVEEADAAGLQVHIHAIGDHGVHMALNAFEHAQGVNGRCDARHQISHLHLTATEDLPRFRKLGVIANVQPFFADNGAYNDRVRQVLGEERSALVHRFRDFQRSGATLVVSTDYPVSPLNPLETIQVAVTRQEIGSDAPPFNFEQRLTLPEVIAAYTIGGAYANFLDDESGSLEIGKWADFVMFDRNLFEIAPEQIHEATVLWTVLEGREAFRTDGW